MNYKSGFISSNVFNDLDIAFGVFDNIDFVENSEDFDNLLDEIHQPHQGIKYFNPS